MTTYAIGDLQGCHDQMMELVARLDAISPQCRLIFVGDIVNRGPKSLETLRRVRAFGDRARMVLGNHDLNLLAVAAGLRRPHRSDTIADILEADDRDELLGWLRRQPLALYEDKHLFVHAGVLPQWTVAQTLTLAEEVHAALQGPYWIEFLKDMYGNEPSTWHDDLQGADRLRCIVNALTRVRYCDADGRMDFKSKEGFIEGAAPDGLMPWFNVPSRKTAGGSVVFGHWSTLGLIVLPNLVSLDTGCVWGGQLSAVNLQDHTVVQIDCPQQQEPNE